MTRQPTPGLEARECGCWPRETQWCQLHGAARLLKAALERILWSVTEEYTVSPVALAEARAALRAATGE